MKANIESRRVQNEFGIIIWQYNEIWPTGGWGSIEYGSERPGQVTGGRWKPLHHFYENSIFTDITLSCGIGDINSYKLDGGYICNIRNDSPFPFTGDVTIYQIYFNNSTQPARVVFNKTLSLEAGPGKIQWYNLPEDIAATDSTANEAILYATITAGSECLMVNTIPLSIPGNMSLGEAQVKVTVADKPNTDGSVDVTVRAQQVYIYIDR